jgi:signal transduction histidine kinase
MPSRWYRSLYWRIAIGFMLCLAVMLVVQAVLFIWVASRAGPTMPGQPPARFAETVALDIAGAIEREPTLDVEKFVHEQYGRDSHPVLVMMRGGRVIENGGGPFPEPLVRQARAMLERRPLSDTDRFDRGARFGRGDRGGLGPGSGFRPMRPAPIMVRDQVVGVVVVPLRAPFGFLLSRYAPTLALVTSGVLIVGALVAAVVIFGPARRRLRAVEQAARQLGGGDLSARAPSRGGDEVAAVATAFNAMADDLAARADALAASDRARRQLLADVSHELTTPVTAMRGYLETLRMPEFDLDEATRSRYLGIVDDETARLERIIRDLLDLARFEGGGGELVIEHVPVAQLFERVTARHERASREAGISITSVIEPGAEIITGDRDRLEQALQNLAANAMRYAPRGTSIELRARVHREVEALGLEKTGVTITVTDEGPGIATDHLPHVFDRFYKAESSRAQGAAEGLAGGSGLGLSIVKAIVERHGGRISVSSRPGRTVFELTIKN